MKVLITGASSGIGRDIAREFAKRGYDIVLVARNIERLQALQKELTEKFKVKTVYESIDLTVRENVISLHDKYKDIDILVNNAGLGDFGKFDETSLEKDLILIDTNIVSVHILTKLYLKDFKEKNSGKILNVASIAGFLPGPLMATYYATKNYVVRLTEAIREELRKDKSCVQVSLLCPGPVDTNFNNTANVRFSLKGKTSEYVSKVAVDKLLKGKFYITPGLDITVARIFSRFLTSSSLAKICYNQQKKKNDK